MGNGIIKVVVLIERLLDLMDMMFFPCSQWSSIPIESCTCALHGAAKGQRS